MKRSALLLIGAFGFAGAAGAAPVDLSSWSTEGTGGNWDLAADNNSVVQTVNTSTPAVFYNNQNSQGRALSGQIEVQTTGDDDFIGFVLGFDTGDSTSAGADYLLIDWKQNNQSLGGGVNGLAGLAISRVTGAFDFNDFWAHTGVVAELARGATLGSTGWVDNTEYGFDLIFNPSRVQVFVDDVLELDVSGTFEDGSFGFYNLSQPNVRYAGIQEEEAPPELGDSVAVPEPGGLALLGLGLAGLGAIRRRRSERGSLDA